MKNKDGVISELFYMLCKRQDYLKESDGFFELRIPDTVIINFNLISRWYFSSRDGKIMRKNSTSLTHETVYKAFSEGNEASGIVASFIYSQNSGNDLFPLKSQSINDQTSTREDITVKYMNKDELYSFLFDKKDTVKTGVLQKFIEPENEINNMIQVIWSPSICLFSKRLSNKKITDKKYDVIERASTFDGPDIYSTLSAVKSSEVSKKLKEITQNIITRVSIISYGSFTVNRLVCNFKLDSKNRINFLYATSIRYDPRKKKRNLVIQSAKTIKLNQTKQLLPFEEIYQDLPNINRTKTLSFQKPKKIQFNLKCLMCQALTTEKGLFEVENRHIIDYENRNLISKNRILYRENYKDLKRENEASEIPNIFKKLYKDLTAEKYQIQKKNQTFPFERQLVCSDCYFLITRGVHLLEPKCLISRVDKTEAVNSLLKKDLNKEFENRSKFLENSKNDLEGSNPTITTDDDTLDEEYDINNGVSKKYRNVSVGATVQFSRDSISKGKFKNEGNSNSISFKKSISGLNENFLMKLLTNQSKRKSRKSVSNRVNQFTDIYFLKNANEDWEDNPNDLNKLGFLESEQDVSMANLDNGLVRLNSLNKQSKGGASRGFRLSINIEENVQTEPARAFVLKPKNSLTENKIDELHEEASNYFFSNFKKITERAIEKEGKKNRRLNHSAHVPKSLKQIKEEKETEYISLAKKKMYNDLLMNRTYYKDESFDETH